MLLQLSKPLQENIEKKLNTNIVSTHSIGGGSINQTMLLQTTEQQFFIKYNTISTALDMFEKEAKGLNLLRSNAAFKIPEVIAIDQVDTTAYLILEYLKSGKPNQSSSQQLGVALATLHQQTALQFGLDHDNYIGQLPQLNLYWETWADFYREQRLLPQMKMARDAQRLNEKDTQQLDHLCQQLSNICPLEIPALTHGDLWAGNYLIAEDEQPILIDPAVSYAHREMDIAMSRLFGGFDAAFYHAYHDIFPLESGWEDRLEIYQLYYLLVHVNLFGGSYVHRVRSILKRF